MKISPSIFVLPLLLVASATANAASVLIEAEGFGNTGGWSIDQQFMDIMGSPYLIAHGIGKPVEDATTTVELPAAGEYHAYIRTYNWTSPWHVGLGPGEFVLTVDGEPTGYAVGTSGNKWEWQYAGKFRTETPEITLGLHDMTGFDGRCDAIYLTDDMADVPAGDAEGLKALRAKHIPIDQEGYDLVVAGGGIAGISAAVSAARLGCKVALINDRPVLGGNNSSEIRVHLGGAIDIGDYPQLGALQKEFGPEREGNAQPADYYEDDKKQAIVNAERNITTYLNYRLDEVDADNGHIRTVTATNTATGERVRFAAPLFADCTGDATLGYLAGAEYMYGREGRDEYDEPTAPALPDNMTMGASVQWRTKQAETAEAAFPVFEYGLALNDDNCHRVEMGEWTWETGMSSNQIYEAERIRDYGMLVVYSNWSYLRNRLGLFPDRELEWVAYVAGKRESRRLKGDYLLTERDMTEYRVADDASFAATWSIDLHFPDPENSADFPGNEFIASTAHVLIYPYPVPYRCLYSRNIDNLFMAGRNISVSHVALGSVRVMRTTGMMGEVVGMASAICREHSAMPRDVYTTYLSELKELMSKGVAKPGLPNNQQYNEGGRLSTKPVRP